MPVRGKILNCLKADYPRIFKSEIITDLLKVLGCGVEVPGKFVKDLNAFDINNLRWNKVILCTDADVDGFQIRTLILTMIYRLCPTLIREGYVYSPRPRFLRSPAAKRRGSPTRTRRKTTSSRPLRASATRSTARKVSARTTPK